MEDKKDEKKTEEKEEIKEEPKEKKETGFLVLISIIGIIFLVFSFIFVNFTNEKTLEEKCTAYQNDPGLLYDCICMPTTRLNNESDLVDVKTDGLCTCFCDIGNNQTADIEIRVANH